MKPFVSKKIVKTFKPFVHIGERGKTGHVLIHATYVPVCEEDVRMDTAQIEDEKSRKHSGWNGTTREKSFHSSRLPLSKNSSPAVTS